MEPDQVPSQLNHVQFATNVNEGGASRHLHTDVVPTKGFAVSEPGFERIQSAPLTPHQVAMHQQTMRINAHLNPERYKLGPDSYQGGWKDTGEHGDEHFLDHSRVFQDQDAAETVGFHNHERAYYDLENRREIRLDDRPERYVGTRDEAKTRWMRSLPPMKGYYHPASRMTTWQEPNLPHPGEGWMAIR